MRDNLWSTCFRCIPYKLSLGNVCLKDRVKRPRRLHFDHVIDTVCGKVTEKSVVLTVGQEDRSSSVGSSRHLVHSQSSPMLLKGAWGMRSLENALPPFDPKGGRHQGLKRFIHSFEHSLTHSFIHSFLPCSSH